MFHPQRATDSLSARMWSDSKWVKEAAFFLVVQFYQNCWFWVPGIPHGLFCTDLTGKASPLSSGPRAQVTPRPCWRHSVESHSWIQLLSPTQPDYTRGTGLSPICIWELEQDLGLGKGGWCFSGLTLGPQQNQAWLAHPNSLNFEVSLVVERRDPCVPGHYLLLLSLRVSSGQSAHV